MSYSEHMKQAQALRKDPMIEAWIDAYQTADKKWSTHEDCRRCGFPHSPHVLCGVGAQFGRLKLGADMYSIDYSNVVFFHSFMLELGTGWGFHWRNQTYFKRDDTGAVEVRYIEQYNNHPQVKLWRIPAAEWASIVASVGHRGETASTYSAALNFHSEGRAVPHHGSGPDNQ